MYAALASALEWLRADEIIARDSVLFLKPNLTWRQPVPGVTTSPTFIEAVVRALRDYASRVIIGESDGGYHSFRAERHWQATASWIWNDAMESGRLT